jgi:hypothetical protein
MTELINEPVVNRTELGRKQVDDETLIRIVGVFGDYVQGFQASYEEWFIPAGGTEPEFFEVLFDTTTHPTADAALADAMPSAIKETAAWLPGITIEQPTSLLNAAKEQVESSDESRQLRQQREKLAREVKYAHDDLHEAKQRQVEAAMQGNRYRYDTIDKLKSDAATAEATLAAFDKAHPSIIDGIRKERKESIERNMWN